MVIIEAMYCGVRTFSTNHAGPKSIINHGLNGFLIDENNIIAATTKLLEERLFKNKEFIAATQQKARQFYKINQSKKWGGIMGAYIFYDTQIKYGSPK